MLALLWSSAIDWKEAYHSRYAVTLHNIQLRAVGLCRARTLCTLQAVSFISDELIITETKIKKTQRESEKY